MGEPRLGVRLEAGAFFDGPPGARQRRAQAVLLTTTVEAPHAGLE